MNLLDECAKDFCGLEIPVNKVGKLITGIWNIMVLRTLNSLFIHVYTKRS